MSTPPEWRSRSTRAAIGPAGAVAGPGRDGGGDVSGGGFSSFAVLDDYAIINAAALTIPGSTPAPPGNTPPPVPIPPWPGSPPNPASTWVRRSRMRSPPKPSTSPMWWSPSAGPTSPLSRRPAPARDPPARRRPVATDRCCTGAFPTSGTHPTTSSAPRSTNSTVRSCSCSPSSSPPPARPRTSSRLRPGQRHETNCAPAATTPPRTASRSTTGLRDTTVATLCAEHDQPCSTNGSPATRSLCTDAAPASRRGPRRPRPAGAGRHGWSTCSTPACGPARHRGVGGTIPENRCLCGRITARRRSRSPAPAEENHRRRISLNAAADGMVTTFPILPPDRASRRLRWEHRESPTRPALRPNV